jgi:hypothetical protein
MRAAIGTLKPAKSEVRARDPLEMVYEDDIDGGAGRVGNADHHCRVRLNGQMIGAALDEQTVTLTQANLPNVAPTFVGNTGEVSVTTVSPTLFGEKGPEGGVAGATGTGVAILSGTYGNLSSTGVFTPSGTISSINGNVTQTSVANSAISDNGHLGYQGRVALPERG